MGVEDWLNSRSPSDGLPVLFVLCREWMFSRDQLEALGVKDPDRLDEMLTTGPQGARLGANVSDVRRMGGEVG